MKHMLKNFFFNKSMVVLDKMLVRQLFQEENNIRSTT